MDTAQSDQPQQPDTAMLYRTLLERTLTDRVRGMFDQRVTAIVPGGLPEGLPFEVPLPTPHTLIGSILLAWEVDERTSQISNIYFDTPLAEGAIFEFFKAHLTDWSEDLPFEMQHQQGGFQARFEVPGSLLVFMHAQLGSLTVRVREGEAGVSAVHLAWHSDVPQLSRVRQRHGLSPLSMFPRLVPPPKARSLTTSGGGGSDHDIYTSARVTAPLDLVSIVQHYDDQLRAAGWQLQGSLLQPPVAWSRWRFTTAEGEPWRGTLLVTQDDERPDRFKLYLDGEFLGDVPPSGTSGGFVHRTLRGG